MRVEVREEGEAREDMDRCHERSMAGFKGSVMSRVRLGKLNLLLLWVESLSLLAYDDIGESLVVFDSPLSSPSLRPVVTFLLRCWRRLLLDFACSR